MSINPVSAISSTTEAQAPTAESHAQSRSSMASAQPVSGRDPKSESVNSPESTLLSELPQDEVEVQRDSQADGTIVVRYMDHAGNLILQVPSEQVLGVTRAIDQDLEHEQELRAKAEGPVEDKEEGKSG